MNFTTIMLSKRIHYVSNYPNEYILHNPIYIKNKHKSNLSVMSKDSGFLGGYRGGDWKGAQGNGVGVVSEDMVIILFLDPGLYYKSGLLSPMI